MIVHEYGHFFMARLGGMHVDRFSVFGIGPVALRLFEYEGCEFVISWIPFGAYVHIVGMEAEEDEESGIPQAPEGFTNFRDASLPKRVGAILGGPAANYLAAMVICVGLFTAYGLKQIVGTQIGAFSQDSAAQAAGLQVGDEFLKIDGEAIPGPDAVDKVIQSTASRLGQTVDIEIKREGQILTLPVKLNDQAPALGAQLAPQADFVKVSIGQAVYRGVTWPFQKSGQMLSDLWRLITGQTEAELSGPLGIMKVISNNSNSVVELFSVVAVISVALGLFNLLPLPALDGGRLLFLIIEAVARRPVNKKVEETIHGVGMIGLLLLIGYVTINDYKRDFSGSSDDDKQVESGSAQGE